MAVFRLDHGMALEPGGPSTAGPWSDCHRRTEGVILARIVHAEGWHGTFSTRRKTGSGEWTTLG